LLAQQATAADAQLAEAIDPAALRAAFDADAAAPQPNATAVGRRADLRARSTALRARPLPSLNQKVTP
jgi:hypothetical protein